jgi:hypothetical protein
MSMIQSLAKLKFFQKYHVKVKTDLFPLVPNGSLSVDSSIPKMDSKAKRKSLIESAREAHRCCHCQTHTHTQESIGKGHGGKVLK